ncbi:hypothetical protein EDD11_006632 [Mortierella claussenii]|nr:hypothetical protein EDD11_006632 [Mortierella claussenii]
MAAYLPYSGGHGRAGSAGKDQEYRKTGIPGRNGEEPETNVFNFVDIMMNMPENPSWQQIIKKLLKTMAVMTISYFLLMSLFFAAEFESTKHLENISILVVDLDKSVIGNMFLNFTQQDNKYPGQVNWSVQSGYKDVASVISDVENGNYWGAMVAQANASMILNKALATPLADYDPTKAFLFVYDGGRDPLAVKPYVVASMYTQFLEFTKVFNPAWVKFVLQFADENSKAVTPLMNAPQVLGTPVAFEELDLHPPTATIITSATSVAYIWVFLIAGGSTYLVAHAVQPMTRHATSAGQFMSLFMGMLLLQSAVASLVLFLIFLIPVVFIPLVTITFVVMNVIAVFNPVDLMPTFYRWVYAMPFLNAVQMARYVLMGSYNRLNYNLPILFAWIIVPITLLPFAIARQKRLMMEIMEPEEQERQQRYHADKERSYGRYADSGQEEDYYDRYDDDAYYCGDKSMRHDHRRRSREFERFRSGRSKHHYRGRYQADEYAMSHDQDEDIMDGEGSDDDGEEDRSDGREDSSYDRIGALNASRLIRPPLNSRAIGGGVVSPSAPPESQIFDLHNRAAGRDQDNNRSYIEMPKLSRHPYASELVQAQSTPDEVKQ